MADDVCFALLRNTIYQILHSAGFESSHGEPANVLADVFGQYIQLLASSASTYAQLAGRTVASPWDIADGLVDVQVTLDQLQDWLDSEQGQFLAPSWSTKVDPNSVLKDVVTKGQVHHDVSQILYEYCAADQHFHQAIDGKLEYTNGGDVSGTAATSSTIRQDRGQRTISPPDYVPLHLPSFPSLDSDDIVSQPNDTPHQSNQKRDDTTMQPEYSTTTMLSSLLPSTDHKLPSTSISSTPNLLLSRKTNDNPFTHVVSFDDSSLASGNSLSLALSSVYSKPSSSFQQQPQQLDLNEKNELELAKKQRRAEINGTMETTISTIMDQYRQQQKQLEMEGNQVMFQDITQKEAAPGKSSLGTRDSILDEMVYRLAPPVALARFSSPNLLLDTAITPISSPENPASASSTTEKDAPANKMDTGNQSTQTSLAPPPPSLSTLEQTASLPAIVTSSSPQTYTSLSTQPPTKPPKVALSSSSSTADNTHTNSSTTPHHQSSNNTNSFGSPPIPTSSQSPVKTPMSIAMLSARGSTNLIKKDKNGLPVKVNEAKNGTVLPKKKKKPRAPVDTDDDTKRIPTTPSRPPPQTGGAGSAAAVVAATTKQYQQQVISSTNSLPPTTTNTELMTTLLKKKRKKKDYSSSNGLGRERSGTDTPKVRFKEQVDISNSSYESQHWSTPSPSLHRPAQPILSTTKPTIPTSALTPHTPMNFTAAAASSSPVPLSSSASTLLSSSSPSSSSAAPTPSSSSSSSSYKLAPGHVKKKKKKEHNDQQARSFASPAMTPTKPAIGTATATATKMTPGDGTMAPSFYQPKKSMAPIPTLPLHSSSSSSSSATVVANPTTTPIATTIPIATTATPIMLLPTPATNMYYDNAETVKCICENPTVDYGSFMISCDRCLVWFHGSCVGIAEHHQVDYWICNRCQ